MVYHRPVRLLTCAWPLSGSQCAPSCQFSSSVSPAGHEPTTPTILPVGSGFYGSPCLFTISQSAAQRSSLPITTGSLFFTSTQTSSHQVSCGHTRPQIAGSASWISARKWHLHIVISYALNKRRDIDLYRAPGHTGKALALVAPAGLIYGLFTGISHGHFIKVKTPLSRVMSGHVLSL